MNHYLNGILLIGFGAVLALTNAYLFFQDYKWQLVHSAKVKGHYLLPNFVVLFLSVLTIVGGIIYLFIVNNQLV